MMIAHFRLFASHFPLTMPSLAKNVDTTGISKTSPMASSSLVIYVYVVADPGLNSSDIVAER